MIFEIESNYDISGWRMLTNKHSYPSLKRTGKFEDNDTKQISLLPHVYFLCIFGFHGICVGEVN